MSFLSKFKASGARSADENLQNARRVAPIQITPQGTEELEKEMQAAREKRDTAVTKR
jgi:hypothetical protein